MTIVKKQEINKMASAPDLNQKLTEIARIISSSSNSSNFGNSKLSAVQKFPNMAALNAAHPLSTANPNGPRFVSGVQYASKIDTLNQYRPKIPKSTKNKNVNVWSSAVMTPEEIAAQEAATAKAFKHLIWQPRY